MIKQIWMLCDTIEETKLLRLQQFRALIRWTFEISQILSTFQVNL